MPVLNYTSLDEVPEGLREFVKTQDDGKVTVNVVPESKLSEFRDNNIKVVKERDELLDSVSRLKGIVGEDPDAFEKDLAELRVTRDRVEAGDLKEGRALEEAIGKRTEEMRRKFEDELQNKGRESVAWRDKYGQLERKFKDGQIVQAIKDAAVNTDSGVAKTAIGDIAARALTVFHYEDDGRIVPKNGDVTLYGSNGVDPMTPGEWLQKLKEDAPHFFMATQGGGAGGDTTKKNAFGMSHADLQKLTPAQKLALANKEGRPFGK